MKENQPGTGVEVCGPKSGRYSGGNLWRFLTLYTPLRLKRLQMLLEIHTHTHTGGALVFPASVT